VTGDEERWPGEPVRWALLVGSVACLTGGNYEIYRRLPAADFDVTPAGLGAAAYLFFFLLLGVLTIASYSLLPGPLRKNEMPGYAATLALFFGLIPCCVGLLGLLNRAPDEDPREFQARLTRYETSWWNRKAGPDGVLVPVGQGEAIEVKKSALDKAHIALGDPVRVTLYEGRLWPWGRVARGER